YTLTLSDLGNRSAANVVLTDAAPAGTTFVAGSAQVVTNLSGGTVMNFIGDDAGEDFLRLELDHLDGYDGLVSGFIVVSFQVTVDSPVGAFLETIANTAQVSASGIAEFDSNNVTIDVDAAPSLTATKSVVDTSGDGFAQAGEILTYTITVNNTGGQDAASVSIVDAAPTGTTFVEGSALITSNTTGGNITSFLGDETGESSLQVDIDNFAGNGGSITITFQVQMDLPLPLGQATVDNTAQVSALGITEFDSTEASLNVDQRADLRITKSVVDTSGDGLAQASETLTYTLVVTNVGGLRADNVIIGDMAPAGTTFLGGSAQILNNSTGGGVVNFIGDGSGEPFLQVVLSSIDGNGGSITITFQVLVDARLSATQLTIDNTAQVSAVGISQFDSDVSSIDVDATASLTLDKSVVDASGDGQAQPGELLTYTLLVTNVGTRDAVSLVLSDLAPTGTTFVAGSATLGSSSGAGSVTGFSGDEAGENSLQVDLDGLEGAGGFFTVNFQVQVDSPVGAFLETIANTAQASASGIAEFDSNNVTIDVDAAPSLSATKSVVDTSGDGFAQAGEVLTYTVTVSNAGGQDAASVSISDLAPAGTSFVAGSALITSNTTGGSVTSFVGDESGESSLQVDIDNFAGNGGSITITFQVLVDARLSATQLTIDNTAQVSAVGISQFDSDVSSIDVDATASLTLDKSVVDASGDGQAQPGELLTYTLLVTNVGTRDAVSLVLSDLAPTGTTFVAGSATLGSSSGAGSVTGFSGDEAGENSLQVDLDGLEGAGGFFTVSFQVQVDALHDADVTSIDNLAQVSATGIAAFDSSLATIPLDADPDLAIIKSVSDASGDNLVQAGEVLTYTLTVTNNGNQGASSVSITDAAPAYTAFIAGSAQIVSNNSGGSVTGFLGDEAGETTLQVDLDQFVGGGGSIVITFQVLMDTPLPVDVLSIDNTAQVSGNGVTPVTSLAASIDIEQAPVLRITKSVSDAASGNNDGLAQAGETLEYTIVVSNVGNIDDTNVVLSDLAPTGTTFVDGSALIVSDASGAGASTIIGDDAGEAFLQIDLDKLVAGGQLTVSFLAVVNNPVAATLTSIDNTAQLSSDSFGQFNSQVASIDVDAAAALVLDKSVVDASGDNLAQTGEILTYTLTLENQGTRNASSVSLSDLAPTGTTFVAGSAFIVSNTSGGTVTSFIGDEAGETALQLDLDQLNGSGSIVVSFQVVVDAVFGPGSISIDNTAQAQASGIAAFASPVNSIDIDASADLSTSTKSVVDTSGDGFAQADEILTYTITVTNTGDRDAANVRTDDLAPASTSYVDGSAAIVNSSGATNAQIIDDIGNLTVTVDELAGLGGFVTVQFSVRVASSVGFDIVLSNTAQVQADGISTFDTPSADITARPTAADHFDSTLWADYFTNTGWSSQLVGDFNGDGRDDIANFHPSTGNWWVSLANSTGTGFVTSLWADFYTNTGWTSQVVGDFNGDGYDDIANFHPSTGNWWVSITNEARDGFTTTLWADFATNSGWTAQLVGDFSGDGKDDIANFHPSTGNWWVSVANETGTGFTTTLWADYYTNSGWTNYLAGNFNGDPYDDVASFHPSNGNWWVGLAQPGAATLTLDSAAVMPAADVFALTQAQLDSVVVQALQIFADLGVGPARFGGASFSIADLSGRTLGRAGSSAIVIDLDGAGHGWSLDDEVNEDEVDLLSVVLHELGHELGLEHADAGFMAELIGLGERRLPTAEELDEHFAGD
ncbi:MAG: FG-GAP-like repeat-containing protein, partial [Gemmataceae bacterium]